MTVSQTTTEPSPNHTVRIGLIQHACPPGADRPANLDKAVQLIRNAAAQGAQIIATQELFASNYFPQTEDEANFALAEPIPGPTSNRLGMLAKELGVEIIASLFEKRTPGVFHNACILINTDGRIAGKYRKMHVPDDPGFYEKFYFAPGDLGWPVTQTRYAKTGMLVCWDQWFPEAARLVALRGAQILFYPTAIGWVPEESARQHAQQKEAWVTVQRAHAITNGVFVAAINRVGVENDLTFWGSSFVVDPAGTIIAQAGEKDEQVLIADCDLSRIDDCRQGWPFLRDRRIDAYGDLTERFLDT